MAALVAHIDLLNFPEVKALYDAANTAATLIPDDLDPTDDGDLDILKARKFLVDALIAFREGQ
jgi:hypothetical protein